MKAHNYLYGIAILLAIILFSFGAGFWFGWQANYKWGEKIICPEISVKSDTTKVKNAVSYSKTIPVKKQVRKWTEDTAYFNKLVLDTFIQYNIFDTIEYFDTYCDSNVNIELTESIACGEVLTRNWKVQSIANEIVRTETKTIEVAKKQPLLKVYLGVFGGSKFQGATGLSGASFGGDITTVWNDRFIVRGAVDGLQRSAQVGFGVKLSFKK